RIIRAHGVTYNVYGDAQGMDRPWGLDFVPLLITAREWARIEGGLVQRSRLFNLILADLYGGRQHLLRDGLLPPDARCRSGLSPLARLRSGAFTKWEVVGLVGPHPGAERGRLRLGKPDCGFPDSPRANLGLQHPASGGLFPAGT